MGYVKILRLTEPIIMSGVDLRGQPCEMLCYPIKKPGFFWKSSKETPPVPILPRLADKKLRRLVLKNGEYRLDVFEHFGALRWFGFDGLVLATNGTAPYFGRALEFCRALKIACVPSVDKMSWMTVKKRVYSYHLWNPWRFVELRPHTSGNPCLKVRIYIDYPGLGSKERVFVIPGEPLEEIFETYALGWPSWLYYISKNLPLSWWCHHCHVNWPQQCKSKDEALDKALRHHLLDLLGYLALLCNGHLLAGEVVSCMAGHSHDLNLIRKISPDMLRSL